MSLFDFHRSFRNLICFGFRPLFCQPKSIKDILISLQKESVRIAQCLKQSSRGMFACQIKVRMLSAKDFLSLRSIETVHRENTFRRNCILIHRAEEEKFQLRKTEKSLKRNERKCLGEVLLLIFCRFSLCNWKMWRNCRSDDNQ